MLAYFAAQGAFWAYASLIGKSKGLSDESVAAALALSQFTGIAGALVPAALGDRLGRGGPLGIGVLCGILPLALLVGAVRAPVFIAVVAVYQFGWNLSHPFLLGMFARFDRTGQVVVYGTAMQKLGLAAGPAAAASVLAYDGYGLVVMLSMALCALSLLLVVPAIRAQAPVAPST
jgi:predicted MFS family arabinose efflux permease